MPLDYSNQAQACHQKLKNITDEEELDKITIKIDKKYVSLSQIPAALTTVFEYIDLATTAAGLPVSLGKIWAIVVRHINQYILRKRLNYADQVSETILSILRIKRYDIKRVLLDTVLAEQPELLLLGGAHGKDTITKLLKADDIGHLRLLAGFSVLRLRATPLDTEFNGTKSIADRIKTAYLDDSQTAIKLLELLRSIEQDAQDSSMAKSIMLALSNSDTEYRQKSLDALFKVTYLPLFDGHSDHDVIHHLLFDYRLDFLKLLFVEAGVRLETRPSQDCLGTLSIRERITHHAETVEPRINTWIPILETLSNTLDGTVLENNIFRPPETPPLTPRPLTPLPLTVPHTPLSQAKPEASQSLLQWLHHLFQRFLMYIGQLFDKKPAITPGYHSHAATPEHKPSTENLDNTLISSPAP